MTAWTMEEALRRLSEEHRVALVTTYLRGRPYGEVSAELGVPGRHDRNLNSSVLRAAASLVQVTAPDGQVVLDAAV